MSTEEEEETGRRRFLPREASFRTVGKTSPHLNCCPVRCCDNVSRPHSVTANHVFTRCHNEMNFNIFRFQLPNNLGSAESLQAEKHGGGRGGKRCQRWSMNSDAKLGFTPKMHTSTYRGRSSHIQFHFLDAGSYSSLEIVASRVEGQAFPDNHHLLLRTLWLVSKVDELWWFIGSARDSEERSHSVRSKQLSSGQ